MQIRRALSADFPRMIEMGARMHAAGKYAFLPYDRKKLAALADALDKSPDGLLLIAEHEGKPFAMLVATVQEYYFCHAKIATDLLIWVDESERGGFAGSRLIEYYVDWAKGRGAVEAELCNTNGGDGDRITKLYERHSFERVGSIHKRGL